MLKRNRLWNENIFSWVKYDKSFPPKWIGRYYVDGVSSLWQISECKRCDGLDEQRNSTSISMFYRLSCGFVWILKTCRPLISLLSIVFGRNKVICCVQPHRNAVPNETRSNNNLSNLSCSSQCTLLPNIWKDETTICVNKNCSRNETATQNVSLRSSSPFSFSVFFAFFSLLLSANGPQHCETNHKNHCLQLFRVALSHVQISAFRLNAPIGDDFVQRRQRRRRQFNARKRIYHSIYSFGTMAKVLKTKITRNTLCAPDPFHVADDEEHKCRTMSYWPVCGTESYGAIEMSKFS